MSIITMTDRDIIDGNDLYELLCSAKNGLKDLNTISNPDEDQQNAIFETEEIIQELECFDSDSGSSLKDSTFINDNYFSEYIEQLTIDQTGDLPEYLVVNWDLTAQGLLIDYAEVEINNYTYLVRK